VFLPVFLRSFDAGEMSANIKDQIIYASYFMPASIAKELINDADFVSFQKFESKKAEAGALKKQWDEELSSKEAAVNSLKEKLETYKDGFNFVGLSQGFSELKKSKSKEAVWLFGSSIGMGMLILAVPILDVCLWLKGSVRFEKLGFDYLAVLIPLVSIELVLLYFFRIILQNYKSVKTQIMQIELRNTLCQFIQSYAEYASKIKKTDSASLEKFENLIFSGILSDSDKMPSTFDGLEQIGSFIKSMKSS